MTYEESYRNCKTYEEFERTVKNDAMIAMFMGSADRVKIIESTATSIAKEKGWTYLVPMRKKKV
jgi:hypothetical protein